MTNQPDKTLSADPSLLDAKARFLRRSERDVARIHRLVEGDAASMDETAMRDIHNLDHRMVGTAETLEMPFVARIAAELAALSSNAHAPRYDFGLLTLQFGSLLLNLREALFKARAGVLPTPELLLIKG